MQQRAQRRLPLSTQGNVERPLSEQWQQVESHQACERPLTAGYPVNIERKRTVDFLTALDLGRDEQKVLATLAEALAKLERHTLNAAHVRWKVLGDQE
jgi:hypothetical protein